MAAPRFSSAFGYAFALVVYVAPTRLRLRYLTGLKGIGTAQTYAFIWYDWHHQTRHSLVFLKSPPLYIYRTHSCRWRQFFADITFSPHLAMLIRVVGSCRTINTILHRMVRLKPVRLYNVIMVIRFGGLSSFQNCPNNFGVVRVCLACVPLCLHLVAPRHVNSVKYIACRTT